jgi:chromatin assembly factor 1 subunit B
MDLSWSNDSNYLVSGSLDGTSILWSVNKLQKIQNLEGHKKFVQGVSMHPFVKYIASASSDATMRIYKNRKLKNQLQFFHKFTVKQREENEDQTSTE